MSLGPPDKYAARLLAELGLTQPEDIDLEVIASYLRAVIVEESMSGCDGRLLGAGDDAVITVNANAPPGRRRFTAAHEIGHWAYDKGKVNGACTEDKITKGWSTKGGLEQRANRFAAELLMPQTMLKTRIPDAPLDLDAVRDVAEVFSTSLTAAAIRAVEVGPRPAMVICMSKKGRHWFFRNDGVPEQLWPVKSIDRDSLLSGLDATPGATSKGILSADTWTNHDDAHRYELQEDSIMVTSELALTVISWPDEDQLSELLDDN